MVLKTLTSVERMLPTLFTRCVASQSSEVRVGCSVFFAVRVFRIPAAIEQVTKLPEEQVVQEYQWCWKRQPSTVGLAPRRSLEYQSWVEQWVMHSEEPVAAFLLARASTVSF